MTLARRLLILALVAVLPAIAVWTSTEFDLRRAREAEVREQALRQAQLAASEVDRIIDGIGSVLAAVSTVPAVRSFEEEACAAYLAALIPQVPSLDGFVVFDRAGAARCSSSGPARAVRADDRPYFQSVVRTGRPALGEYVESRLTGLRALPLGAPMRGAGGEVIGVVSATIDLRWLAGQLKERALPPGGSLTVADRTGVIVAREPFPERFIGTRIPEAFRKLIDAPAAGSEEIVSQDGTRRVLGYVPATLPPLGLYVSAGLSSEATFAAVDQAGRRGLLTIAATALLSLTGAWIAGRYLAAPFQRLSAAAEAWRRGEYGVRSGVAPGGGEVSQLAATFERLIDEVGRRERELRESEAQARLALEAGAMGTWWYDPRQEAGGWSPHAAQLLGVPLNGGSTPLGTWMSLIEQADRPTVEAALARALSRGEDYRVEFRVRDEGASVRWIEARGKVIRDPQGDGSRLLGVLQDVTARRRADEHQRLLLDELNHRVKNTLATVQSIAAQTLRTTTEPARFREAFEGRLLALSKTHDLLTRNAWRDADMRSLLEQEMAPHRREREDRFALRGPRIRLPARVAINLGLVIHELTTNAAKYGALSAPGGRVSVEWRVRDHELEFVWREGGGPAVAPPSRRGFGSRLIERSITGELGGRAETRFEIEGLVCTISLPLSAEADGAEDGPADPRPSDHPPPSAGPLTVAV